jgi:hypothetical protein
VRSYFLDTFVDQKKRQITAHIKSHGNTPKKVTVTLFFLLKTCYIKYMEIETVSVDMSQSSVQEPPPAPREAEQPAPADTVASAQTITDPNLGQSVNILD